MNSDFKNAGLFLHWGMSTGNDKWGQRIPLYNSHEEWEEAVNAGGWCAEKWINTAKKLRASYITLACFHCCLGYIKAWRSNIPGTYTAKRDFLGELIEAGKKENIKIVVYISGDTTGAEFYKGQKWIDADAYREYKNDNSVDIIDHDIWQTVYCKEVIEEMIDNYPDLGGFWFDGWFCKENAEMLFEAIHKKNPKIMNIRNNFGKGYFKNEDLMSIECFGKQSSPKFDIVSGCWQGDLNAEVCFVMKEISDWWYTGDYPDYYGTDTVKKYAAIAANGWRPKVGIGPKVSGDFPENTERFINQCDKLLSWAEESLFDIKPGIIPQCYVNDGGYILTTYRDKVHYIHVLKSPRIDKLIIKDAGRDFLRADNLKTGEKLSFEHRNGELIFSEDFSSCETDGDYVIKLYESGTGIIAEKNIQEGISLPAEINIDLGDVKKVSGILLKQKNNSTQYNGSWAGTDNNRLKNYKLIGIGCDGTETIIADGALNGVRGNAQINVSAECKGIRLICEDAFDTDNGSVCVYGNSGWKGLEYTNVKSFAVCNDAEYVVTNDGLLNCYVNGERRLIADNVKYVFVGDKVYYIDSADNIISAEDRRETGYTGEKAAADEKGNIYSVLEGVLFENGKQIDTDVTGVCVCKNGIEYCKTDSVISLTDGKKKVTNFAYSFVGITERTFLLADGNVLLRDVNGKDDTFYKSGVSDVVYNDKIYCITPKLPGKCVIEAVEVF